MRNLHPRKPQTVSGMKGSRSGAAELGAPGPQEGQLSKAATVHCGCVLGMAGPKNLCLSLIQATAPNAPKLKACFAF